MMLSKQLRSLKQIIFHKHFNGILNPLQMQFSTAGSGSKGDSQSSEEDIVHLQDRQDIRIPEYPVRPNEPLEKRRQRLLYQSRKRGMLENDLLLSTFAAKYLKTMNQKQIEMYDTLINKPSNDWDIYNWATGTKEIPAEYNNEIMELFKEHVRNEHKEKRLRMPDL